MTTEPESSSSLPTHPAQTFRSSPPILIGTQSFEEMENKLPYKSEPPSGVQMGDNQPPIVRENSGETERPTSAQRVNDDGDKPQNPTDDEEPEDEPDPAERIVDFDWDDLHQRYHDAINKCQEDEQQLMIEWEQLMNYFKIWADSGHLHETNRTYARLRTRMTYVQDEEGKLEKTQNHYVNVVKAFESALNLLKMNSFPG